MSATITGRVLVAAARPAAKSTVRLEAAADGTLLPVAVYAALPPSSSSSPPSHCEAHITPLSGGTTTVVRLAAVAAAGAAADAARPASVSRLTGSAPLAEHFFEGEVAAHESCTVAFRLVFDDGHEEWVPNGKSATVIVGDAVHPADATSALVITPSDGHSTRVLPASPTAPSQAILTFPRGSARPTLSVADMAQHAVVERSQLWWLEGRAGESQFHVESDSAKRRAVQVVVAQTRAGGVVVVVPFPPGFLRADAAEALTLDWDDRHVVGGAAEGYRVYVGVGDDVQGVLGAAAEAIRREVNGGVDVVGSAIPASVAANPPSQIWDYFAWCTWDAFYKEVTEAKVLAGVEELHRVGIPVEVVLIDDGWQDYNNKDSEYKQELVSILPDMEKFPNGLDICRALKEKGVKYVGVWHTLIGCWNGVSPDGPIGKKYKLTKVTKRDGSVLHVVDAVDVSSFYEEMHQYLRDNGVDFVKVDHQAFFDDLVPEDSDRLWAAYQKAMIEQASKMPAVWCMSHSPNIIFDSILGKLGSGSAQREWQNTFRNSDDFWPARPASHTWHVYTNAINTLMLGTFSAGRTILDWDMFHSVHTYGWLHGCARAVSGGPVYVSDKPGSHDGGLLRALTAGGRGLRCRGAGGAASPARLDGASGAVFVDPTRAAAGASLLAVRNVNANVGGGGDGAGVEVVGVFNCLGDPADRTPAAAWVAPEAAAKNAAGAGDVVAWFGRAQVARVVPAGKAVPVLLESGDAEVVSFAPIVGAPVGVEVACLGLLGKLNGGAAISNWTLSGTESTAEYRATVWVSGVIGFYVGPASAGKVVAVEVNGTTLGSSLEGLTAASSSPSARWSPGTGILEVDSGKEVVGDVTVTLRFVTA
ncbi:glycoside hydrolase superfamily [Zopfochytrium polystomum]|nr:glycoside hydrolase superfamily [Zopfochytrium polystomum]